MTLSEATDTVRRMVSRKDGVVRVGEGKGTVVVYVDNMNAAGRYGPRWAKPTKAIRSLLRRPGYSRCGQPGSM